VDEHIFKTDVAVVGAGGCGLTAALAAAEGGSQVLLLERAPDVGGTTAMSVGIIVAAGSRLQLANGEDGTAVELAADIIRMNKSQSDPTVTEVLCRASGPLVDWLEALGVPLEHMKNYRYSGMSRSWMLSPPQRQGSMMTAALKDRIVNHTNINLLLGTAVTKLISSGSAVSGLEAMAPDGERFTVHSKVIILAAAGFGASPELVGRYIPGAATMPYYGSAFADGDAIQWGQAMGGAVDHMSAYQSHSSIAHPEMILVTTYLINHGAIQVNQQGRRFGNETDSYATHASAVQSQPGQTVVEIFDEHIFGQTLSDFPRFKECIDAGIVHRSNSTAELARQFGVRPSTLERTLEEYNDAVRAGGDEFGRSRFGQSLTPPYYAIRVTSALVQTLGGLRVDSRARVLRDDGAPLHGLYAGGGTAAGLAGDHVEGYMAGTGLLAAFGLGWIAGREAIPTSRRS